MTGNKDASIAKLANIVFLFSFQLPHDFSALFNATLYKLDTFTLPDVIRYMYVGQGAFSIVTDVAAC